MIRKIKYLVFGIVFLIVALFLIFKGFVTLNKVFEEDYSEYDEVTNQYLDEKEELSREQVLFHNNYLGKNIKDIKDEGLEELPNKEKGLLFFKSASGYKVIMSYDENDIITNIKLECIEKK